MGTVDARFVIAEHQFSGVLSAMVTSRLVHIWLLDLASLLVHSLLVGPGRCSFSRISADRREIWVLNYPSVTHIHLALTLRNYSDLVRGAKACIMCTISRILQVDCLIQLLLLVNAGVDGRHGSCGAVFLAIGDPHRPAHSELTRVLPGALVNGRCCPIDQEALIVHIRKFGAISGSGRLLRAILSIVCKVVSLLENWNDCLFILYLSKPFGLNLAARVVQIDSTLLSVSFDQVLLLQILFRGLSLILLCSFIFSNIDQILVYTNHGCEVFFQFFLRRKEDFLFTIFEDHWLFCEAHTRRESGWSLSLNDLHNRGVDRLIGDVKVRLWVNLRQLLRDHAITDCFGHFRLLQISFCARVSRCELVHNRLLSGVPEMSAVLIIIGSERYVSIYCVALKAGEAWESLFRQCLLQLVLIHKWIFPRATIWLVIANAFLENFILTRFLENLGGIIVRSYSLEPCKELLVFLSDGI